MEDTFDVRWSASFTTAPASSAGKGLQGDRIILPQSALEGIMAAPRTGSDTHQSSGLSLPYPLTFKLLNKTNGRVAYSGVREFIGEETQIRLTPYLESALGISAKDETEIAVTAKQVPKGTYIRLRPLEAGYNPDDWRPILERELSKNFTTLTAGTDLHIKGARGDEFRFLLDKVEPEGEAVCVVDTDVEVDIEALDEEQARETLRIIADKTSSQPAGNSDGGEIDVWKEVEGHVMPGSYVDFTLPSWDRARDLSVEITFDDDDGLDLFAIPRSTRYRALPRESEHRWGDFSTRSDGHKSLTIQPDDQSLKDAESILISVYSHREAASSGGKGKAPEPKAQRFVLRARVGGVDGTQEVRLEDVDAPEGPDGHT
ncbi:hypothetical protein IMZ48_29655, partial [Candidatus Bathyarchaeota archaeon]|nr:hypothetical protein [Candidatus Bathyarchaeota archaeon]